MKKVFIISLMLALVLASTCAYADQFNVNNIARHIERMYNTSGAILGKGAPVILDAHNIVVHSQMAANATTTASDIRFYGIVADTCEIGGTVQVVTAGYAEALFTTYATAEIAFGCSGTTQRCLNTGTGGGFTLKSTAAGTLAPVWVWPKTLSH